MLISRATIATHFIIVCGIATAAQSSSAIVDGPSARAMDAFLSGLAEGGFSGAALVMKDGSVILSKGYGLADREKDIRFTADTVFDIGSLTEQFTAAAILRLESDGKLSITDTVGEFLDSVPPDKGSISLHHLLTHSSGLPSTFGDATAVTERDTFVKTALNEPLNQKVGERYIHSNLGYSLLAAIVESVSGMPYENYLRKTFFDPLGMDRTGYVLPTWINDDFAVGYKDGNRLGTPLEYLWAEDGPKWDLKGNTGILSTVDDLLIWNTALQGNEILSDEAIGKMFTPHVRTYGYAWKVQKTSNGNRFIWYGGSHGVFYTEVDRFPDENTLLIFTSNAAEHSIGSRADQLIKLARRSPPSPDALKSLPFPKPTGPYDVGTFSLHVIDDSRPEPYTEDSADHRELMVQLWYPAKPPAEARRASYLPENPQEALVRMRDLGIDSHLGLLKSLKTYAYAEAPVDNEGAPYPLIIYSHGFGDTGRNNISLSEDLASHGYIVAGITHTYSCAIVTFPGGRQLTFDPSFPGVDPDTESSRDAERTFQVWIDDVRTVIGTLETLGADASDHLFAGHVDFERLGIFGHSFGGSVAMDLCTTDPRFKCGVNFDGSATRTAIEEGVKTPFLVLTAEKPSDVAGRNSDRRRLNGFKDAFRNLGTDGILASVAGMRHMNFCDLPVLVAAAPYSISNQNLGSIHARRNVEIINRCTLALFDKVLKNKTSELLENDFAAFPEMTIIPP